MTYEQMVDLIDLIELSVAADQQLLSVEREMRERIEEIKRRLLESVEG